VEVLWHPAIGALVTHCGWNSIMEAVTAGVPMLCWPMYAKQRRVAMDGYDKVIVKAGEVEAKVRLVMDTEQGKEIRERTKLVKQMAADALDLENVPVLIQIA
jgi:UDP:flavonoid glycosyltransferase YjiC (YdhE family)